MQAISFTCAHENLAATMEKVCQDHAPVIITREREQPVVIMSLEDFESMEETAYLLSSPANALRLRESIDALEKGKGVMRSIELNA